MLWNTALDLAIVMPLDPGKAPDFAMPGLVLHRQVMRRAGLIAMATLLVATTIGLWSARGDIDDEIRAALALARVVQGLTNDEASPSQARIESLRTQLEREPLRHLRLSIHTADGQLLLDNPPATADEGTEAGTPAWRRWTFGLPTQQPLTWDLPQRAGATWRITLSPNTWSEQRESLQGVAMLLGVLALGAWVMLGVMGFNIRRALAPVRQLQQAIARLRDGDLDAASRCAPLTVPELESVRVALATLARSLEEAQGKRLQLGRKLATLQEDERAWLARELHDDWGQRLTALRLDLRVLERELDAEGATARPRVVGLAEQVMALHDELRSMRQRLSPRPADGEPAHWLHELLQELAASWSSRPGRRSLEVTLDYRVAEPLTAELALGVFRCSQEALTNTARHAGATRATLRVVDAEAGGLAWSACDDGVGLPDLAAAMQRGRGLEGMAERLAQQGGELHSGPGHPGPVGPGLCLHALLQREATP
jgi:two-component system sensor histidine kinase UhpB